jgi:hypothetical protein
MVSRIGIQQGISTFVVCIARNVPASSVSAQSYMLPLDFIENPRLPGN